MKKVKILILVMLVIFFSVIAFFVAKGFGKHQIASLEVDSNLDLPIYVNGIQVGSKSYTGTFDAGQTTIKIGSFITQVDLKSGIKTIVRRQFSDDGSQSSGEVVSFTKNDSNNATLAVISDPDGAIIYVDGAQKGFTPLNIDLSSGTHQLNVKANQYSDLSFPVNMIDGYKLIASIDLSPTAPKQTQEIPKPTQKPQTQELNQVMVTILDTPTGFLRVRSLPTTASDEVGQVHPGETYPFIKLDSKTGWYEIQLASASGWISNVYAATASATITP